MTDILCNWLNKEVKLSKKIDNSNFAREFSTGYLIGEVLDKYELQNDFDQFSPNKTSNAKLGNFTRLEPVFNLLEVPFDTNVARDMMTEKFGVATRLMYQVFISLNRKEKAKLTGVAMETMRPSAPVKLQAVESGIYKERLKMITPRQTDLNLEALQARFHENQIISEKQAFKRRFEEEEKHFRELQEQRESLIANYKNNQAQKSEMLAKIQAATVHIPKPPPNPDQALALLKEKRRIREATMMNIDISTFEEKMKRSIPPSNKSSSELSKVSATTTQNQMAMRASNREYIGKIRARLNEDATAREEREKRRRKVLVDQLKSHHAQEEAHREELLVSRLMRQSQQERRIAVHLLHTRHEKEVVRNNRILREKQYEQRRLREFDDALNKEAELVRLAKIEYADRIKKDEELYDKIAKARAEEKYQRHYDMCLEVLLSIVDFTCKVGEYKELTNQLLPPKLMREWSILFVAGKPLFDEPPEGPEQDWVEDTELTAQKVLEEERQKLLDEGDFTEYRTMVGEWNPPEDSQITGPPRENPIVGHIVQRLYNIVHPPTPPPSPPEFPPFPIKACILGKALSGKSTCIRTLLENHRIQMLSVKLLVDEALEAHKNDEVIEEPSDEDEVEDQMTTERTEIIEDDDDLTDEEHELAPKVDALEEETEPELAALNAPSRCTARSGRSGQSISRAKSNRSSRTGRTTSRRSKADKPSQQTQSVSTTSNVAVKEDDNREIEENAKDEGTEKTDPEKPVTSKKSIQLENSSTERSEPRIKKTSLKPTPRAKCGAKAMRFLKKGKPIDDQLTIDIIVEAIQRIPEEMGWILDGFPNTYTQGKLLEKALTGLEAEEDKPKGKFRKSILAPDPRPSAAPQLPGSGINVVILLDLPNKLALMRSAVNLTDKDADGNYNPEVDLPGEDEGTRVNKHEMVVTMTDESHTQEQIQQRLTTFQDQWPKLEKWYNKFGTMRKVDASQESKTVVLEVESILEDTLLRIQGVGIEETEETETAETKEEEKLPEKSQETGAEEVPKEDTSRSRPASKKGSRTDSGKRSTSGGSGKGDKRKSPSSRPTSGKKSGGSRASSVKGGKKGKSPEPEEPPETPKTPLPEPGSDEWEFVDLVVSEELALMLAPQWDMVEETYVNSSKVVFRQVREEREKIIRYFYQIRKDFVVYLQRPDSKQEFVSEWQKEYNSIADDIRDDEETRAELHERVDDLRERLWSICDERKLEAEKARVGVMTDGWLEDHLGLLANYYITLAQGEVDRFQDTVRLQKDYYRAMEGKIPEEFDPELIRLPLVELPVEGRPPSAAASIVSTDSAVAMGRIGTRTSTPNVEVKSSTSKSRSPSAKKKKGSEVLLEAPPIEIEKPILIPLVPRRPGSPDIAAQATSKTGKADKGKAVAKVVEVMDGPSPPDDLDDRLIYDAYMSAVTAIDKITAAEQAAREAEEEAERLRQLEKEKEKEKAAAAAAKGKGGKGGKADKKGRTPSPKKGKATPVVSTPPPPTEETEEEKQRKLDTEKARMEFFFSMQEEAEAAKVRLNLIRLVAYSVMADLRDKAEEAYKDMYSWLGARFLKEMESIDCMAEVMRNAIETSTHIKEELVIHQEDFLVDADVIMPGFEKDVKVLRTPSPKPRPIPVELAYPDTFTIDQIINLYEQFSLTAPTGVLSIKAFQEIFADLSSLTHGTEQIPDMWMHLSSEKLEAMGTLLSPDGEYIDWHTLVLATAQPWPRATQVELLDTLDRFKAMDQKETGFVTRQQYDRVAFWFKIPRPDTPEDPSASYPYDRLANLKETFFDLFSDKSMNPPCVDYVSMLLYFAAHPDPYVGFLHALSIAAGTHMPRLDSQISAVEEYEGENQEVTETVPESATNAMVPLDALEKVLHHGQSLRGDSHRFSVTADPEDAFSMERLEIVYNELGAENMEPVPFTNLIEHPVVQDMVAALQTYRAVDLNPVIDAVEMHL